jgi:hypothetical protein
MNRMGKKIQHEDNHRVLKYGVICEGYNLASWQVDVLKNLQSSGLAKLELIIIPEGKYQKSIPLYSRISKKIFSNGVLYSLWQRFIKQPSSSELVEACDYFKGVDVKECLITQKGRYRDVFSEKDVVDIEGNNLDFILRFGLGILTGSILTCAKYGVWSFHHGDERKYRGRPACFWEMYDGQYTIGGILQRLTDQLDSGIILKRWSIKANLTDWSLNLTKLQLSGSYLPVQVCKDIVNGEFGYIANTPSDTSALIKSIPTNLEMLYFFRRICLSFLKNSLNRLYTEKWIVGVSKGSLQDLVAKGLSQPKWLRPKAKEDFLADPFAIWLKTGLTIYMEKFNARKGLGEIVTFNFDADQGYGPEIPVLSGNNHFSYPFLIYYQDKYYCMPEAKSTGKVCIYEVCETTNKLIEPKILLENHRLSDATIFKYNGKWWILALEGEASLVCFYSDKLFGPYESHNNNPLKIDPSSARPAGPLLVDGDVLIRPSQDCSKEYGWRIGLQKIDLLNENTFKESTVGYLEPCHSWDHNDGIHTISQVGGYLVFDAKKKTLNIKYVWHKFYKKFGVGR